MFIYCRPPLGSIIPTAPSTARTCTCGCRARLRRERNSLGGHDAHRDRPTPHPHPAPRKRVHDVDVTFLSIFSTCCARLSTRPKRKETELGATSSSSVHSLHGSCDARRLLDPQGIRHHARCKQRTDAPRRHNGAIALGHGILVVIIPAAAPWSPSSHVGRQQNGADAARDESTDVSQVVNPARSRANEEVEREDLHGIAEQDISVPTQCALVA